MHVDRIKNDLPTRAAKYALVLLALLVAWTTVAVWNDLPAPGACGKAVAAVHRIVVFPTHRSRPAFASSVTFVSIIASAGLILSASQSADIPSALLRIQHTVLRC